MEDPPLLEARQQAGPTPVSPILARGARTCARCQPNQRGLSAWCEACPLLSSQDPQAYVNILGGQPPKLQLHFLLCVCRLPHLTGCISPGNPAFPSTSSLPCAVSCHQACVPKDSGLATYSPRRGPKCLLQGLMKERMTKVQGASPISPNPAAQ